MCGCGTLGYGLVGMVVLGGWLDLMILEIFPTYDSVILDFWVCFFLSSCLSKERRNGRGLVWFFFWFFF